MTHTYVYSLAVSGTNLFAGTLGHVFLSTNNGASWVNSGFTINTYVNALAVSGTNLFAGTEGGGVFLSTNNGTNWIAASTGLTNTRVGALALFGTNLFAGTAGGVFLSTNDGTSWTAGVPELTSTTVICFAVNGMNIFAGTSRGVYSFSSGWVNTGLADTLIQTLTVSGTNLFAGTQGGVWRRPLSEITSIHSISEEPPGVFALEQNYPNPFNPTTTINYQLPTTSHVSLKVFDILGREVATLVDRVEQPGYKSVQWSATNVSSGVYLYRLQAGSFLDVKKFALVK